MKKQKIVFWNIFLTVILFLSSLNAQQTRSYDEKIRIFEEFVKQQMAIDKIPGLSIGFVKDDFIWTAGFGYADLENKTPATPQSAYRLASNTKSMTAVAILQLTEKGKIDLDADIHQYVPYFPRKQWPVTVRQLLGHLGGISHYRDYDVEGHIKEHKDTKESLEIFADFDLIAEPGTKYQYSSYGYNLLGAVVEGAAHQPFGDYLKEHLWEPLGMTHTYMDDPDEIIPGRVRGYRIIDGEIKNSEFVDISSRFAAGGTRSTIVDLLKYARGLNTAKVLNKKSIDLMFTSMATKDGHFTDYGMAWMVPPVNGRFHVYHTGGQPETRTLVVKFPKENFAIALAYNLEGANLHVYSHRLFQLIFDEPWNMEVYTGNRVDEAIYRGLNAVFNYGMGYFDRYGKPLTTDQHELAEAFHYFNRCVNGDSLLLDYKKYDAKIKDGRHPIANQAFVKIGSFMAAKLQQKYGAQLMDVYHKIGAIGFFSDYMKISKTMTHLPDKYHFTEKLHKRIEKWNEDWKRTCTDETRRVALTPFTNVDAFGAKMKKLISGSHVYPDFSKDLAKITAYFYDTGNTKTALKIAKLSAQLYPGIALPQVMLGNTYVCLGKKKQALRSYQKALKMNKDDEAISAAGLDRFAQDLLDHQKLNEAMDLLNIALTLYPKEARLYHRMGEIYLKRGKGYFEEARKADPTFEPARQILKKIR